MKYFFVMVLLVTTRPALAQKPETFQLYGLGHEGILLNEGWRFYPGDNPAFARPDFDDHRWQPIDPTQPVQTLQPLRQAGVGWLRLRIRPDRRFGTNSLVQIYQLVASEVYLNGRLIERYGVIDPAGGSRAYQPSGEPVAFPLNPARESVLAVRVAYCPLVSPYFPAPLSYSAFSARVTTPAQVGRFYHNRIILTCINLVPSALLLILGLIHLTFFYYNRKQLTNLYFACYTILFALGYLVGAIPFLFHWVFVQEVLFLVGFVFSVVGFWFSVVAHYRLFSFAKGVFFYGITGCGLLSLVMAHAPDGPLKWLGGPFVWVLFSLELLRVTLVALQKKRPGASIVATGHALKATLLVLFINISQLPLPAGSDISAVGSLFFSMSAVVVPLSLSLFLAREFAMISQLLAVKLSEVETLSARTIAQEQERQLLLASQNDMLEKQVATRTHELQQSLNHLKTAQNQLIQREKMASLGELTVGIAHEIQNPLNFVTNFSEVSADLARDLKEAIDQPTPDRQAIHELADDLYENMQYIGRNGQRAAGIVRSMLEHSSNTTGERQPTPVNALVADYLKLAYHGMKAKNPAFDAQVLTDLDPNAGTPELISQALGRVLLNLFNNAFYAVDQKHQRHTADYVPQVCVGTRVQNGQLVLTVKDNGIGIPPNLLPKIYQPFFTTKPTGEGTGLGLSLSYDIITNGHAGQLSVQSEDGEYTEFTIQIPISPSSP